MVTENREFEVVSYSASVIIRERSWNLLLDNLEISISYDQNHLIYSEVLKMNKGGCQGVGCLITTILFFGFISYLYWSGDGDEEDFSRSRYTKPDTEYRPTPRRAPIPKKETLESDEGQFSSNGEHKALVKLIKEAMYKPGSFIHDETTNYGESNDGKWIQIRMKFYGENLIGQSILIEVEAFPYVNGTGFYGFPEADVFQTLHPKNPKFVFRPETWVNLGIRP